MAAPALLFFFDDPTLPVALLSAHLFVYYFGIMADIPPPVCLAAYAASGIARSNPLHTGVQSVRIAVGGFLLPYMFFVAPQLLLEWDWFYGLKALITALVGIFALGTAVVGHIDRDLNPPARIALLIAGLLLLYGELITDIIGLVVFAAIFAWQWWSGPRSRRRQGAAAAAPATG